MEPEIIPPSQQFPPPPLPPKTPHDPYKFIMEPPKKAKAIGVGTDLSKNPFIMKIIFLVGSAVVLMIVAGVLINIFFGSRNNLGDIIVLTETQQEIMRVAARSSESTDQTTKNAAITAQLAVTTQQQEWLTFLAKRGKKVGSEELSAKQNATTDQRLTQAKATSTFDITFVQIMRTQLEAYAGALQDAYNNASSKTEKTLLAEHFKATQLLIEQWPKDTTP